MAGDNDRHIERRIRENRGRGLVNEWSRALSHACGVEIERNFFLPLETTEELKREFFARVKSRSQASKLWWESNDGSNLLAHLLDLSIDARTTPVILFSSIDLFVGAVRVPADCVLRNAMTVWKVVMEDLAIATEDLESGLCLERNLYNAVG